MILESKDADMYKIMGLWSLYLDEYSVYLIKCMWEQEALKTETSTPGIFIKFCEIWVSLGEDCKEHCIPGLVPCSLVNFYQTSQC
jgi:hypothetical protein